MSSRADGVSLAEAIVACFVMTAAMVVSAALYHTALNYSVRIDRKHRAARVVERRLEEVRSWSREHHGTNGDLAFTQGWGAEFGGAPVVDVDYPEFTVKTDIIAQTLYSPSSAFETIHFAAQADRNVPEDEKSTPRTLADSSYLITVEASWGSGTKDRLVARALIADPVRNYGWGADEAFKAIELGATPASLPANGHCPLSATIKDANGRVVKNAVVEWYVDPKSSGKGTIETRPDKTDTATFYNYILVDQDPDPNAPKIKVNTGGSVRIFARVRLGGVEAVNKTDLIVLGAPPE